MFLCCVLFFMWHMTKKNVKVYVGDKKQMMNEVRSQIWVNDINVSICDCWVKNIFRNAQSVTIFSIASPVMSKGKIITIWADNSLFFIWPSNNANYSRIKMPRISIQHYFNETLSSVSAVNTSCTVPHTVEIGTVQWQDTIIWSFWSCPFALCKYTLVTCPRRYMYIYLLYFDVNK